MLAMCWGLGMCPQKQRVLSEGGDHCYLCVCGGSWQKWSLLGRRMSPGLELGQAPSC